MYCKHICLRRARETSNSAITTDTVCATFSHSITRGNKFCEQRRTPCSVWGGQHLLNISKALKRNPKTLNATANNIQTCHIPSPPDRCGTSNTTGDRCVRRFKNLQTVFKLHPTLPLCIQTFSAPKREEKKEKNFEGFTWPSTLLSNRIPFKISNKKKRKKKKKKFSESKITGEGVMRGEKEARR